MALSIWERKARLPFGAQKQVAEEVGVPQPFVSEVINDKCAHRDQKKVRRVRVALARRMRVRVDEAFPAPTAPSAPHSEAA